MLSLDFIDKYSKKHGDFYKFIYKKNQHGDCTWSGNPTVPRHQSLIVVSNPQAIEEIFTASSDRFNSGKANQSLNFFNGDRSLLLLDGKVHQNRRRLLMPPFHGESLQKYSDRIILITDRVGDSLPIDRENDSHKSDIAIA